MNRTYLEEDLGLIRKYFPGATTVALRTPFDLTVPGPVSLSTDVFRPEEDGGTPQLSGGLAWSR